MANTFIITCYGKTNTYPESLQKKGLLEFGVMGIANGILTIYTPYV